MYDRAVQGKCADREWSISRKWIWETSVAAARPQRPPGRSGRPTAAAAFPLRARGARRSRISR